MQFAHRCTRNLFAVMLSVLTVPAAHAAYIVNIQQVGSNVVATGSGSLDTTDLTLKGIASGASSVNIDPSQGFIWLGSPISVSIGVYAGISGPASFGSGSSVSANTFSGSLTGISGEFPDTYSPQGYVSGTALGTSTDTWTNKSFTSLGLTPGTYTWTWGSGADADSFTVNVPEPATFSLFALTSIVLLRRRQRASLLATNN